MKETIILRSNVRKKKKTKQNKKQIVNPNNNLRVSLERKLSLFVCLLNFWGKKKFVEIKIYISTNILLLNFVKLKLIKVTQQANERKETKVQKQTNLRFCRDKIKKEAIVCFALLLFVCLFVCKNEENKKAENRAKVYKSAQQTTNWTKVSHFVALFFFFL